jgi:DNA-binding response OmpR family regulator
LSHRKLDGHNKVLLVDDESDMTTVMKRGLEDNGFSVDVYNDPEKAAEEYKPNSFDIHVFDIRMPRMAGFDLAHKIWGKNPNAQVCFLSSFEIHEDEARKVFKDFRTTCFIKKPMTVSALANHLTLHLQELV